MVQLYRGYGERTRNVSTPADATSYHQLERLLRRHGLMRERPANQGAALGSPRLLSEASGVQQEPSRLASLPSGLAGGATYPRGLLETPSSPDGTTVSFILRQLGRETTGASCGLGRRDPSFRPAVRF